MVVVVLMVLTAARGLASEEIVDDATTEAGVDEPSVEVTAS